jgi:hypothetical protein
MNVWLRKQLPARNSSFYTIKIKDYELRVMNVGRGTGIHNS